MEDYSLYIDHQSLAPLIHALEDVVEHAYHSHQQQYHKYELRKPIYQEFIYMVYNHYQERHPVVKQEEPETAPNSSFLPQKGTLSIEVPCPSLPLQPSNILNKPSPKEQNQIKTRYRHKLQIEIALIQWIICCDKQVFSKKEVNDKYAFLTRNSKKTLKMNDILSLLQKYRLRHIIIRDKNGQEHCVGGVPEYTQNSIFNRNESIYQLSQNNVHIPLQEQQMLISNKVEPLTSNCPNNIDDASGIQESNEMIMTKNGGLVLAK